MKTINKVFVASLAALSIGLSAVGINSLVNNNRSFSKAEANRFDSVTAVYERVTESSQIAAGDTVLIVSTSGQTLRDVGANPAYLYTTSENFYINNSEDEDDERLAFANNAYITELTVYNGSTSGSFAFYGKFTGQYARPDNTDSYKYIYGYISYDIRGSNNSNPGPNDYTSTQSAQIGYFKDATGIRKQILPDSSWTLTFNANTVTMTNVGGHGNLGFTSGYARRFVLGGSEGINLYKKTTIGSINVASQPTTTEYTIGDKFDLSGLSVDVTLPGSVTSFAVDYNNNKGFFQYPAYVYKDENNRMPFTFAASKSSYINVTVALNSDRYIKVNSDLGDYRGKYILAYRYYDEYEYEYKYKALGFNANQNYNPSNQIATVNSNSVISPSANPTRTYFELVSINGNFFLKKDDVEDTKYLADGGSYPVMVDYANEDNAVYVEYDSGHAYIRLQKNDAYLQEGEYEFGFSGSKGNVAELYKLELTEAEINSVNTFVSGFHDATKICYADGKDLAITDSIWNAQTSAFNALTSGAQGVIAGAKYTHNAEEYGSLNDIVDRYDYIISKYTQFNDFMNRKKGSGTYQNNYSSLGGLTPIVIHQNDTAIIVIISVVVVSLSALGTVVFFKKKHLSK